MELKKELGKNIKKYRKLHGLTQENLAEIVGVEVISISSIETGRYFPSPENLVKISKALDVSLAELFDFQGEISCADYVEKINKNINLVSDNKSKLSAIYAFTKSLLN